MNLGVSSSSAAAAGASKPDDEVWAKLVPSDSKYPDIEIRSDTLICSEVIPASSDKHEWCQIIRNSDLCSGTLKNKSSNVILVDGVAIQKDECAGIKCGSEIVPGSFGEGCLSYKFTVMLVQEEPSVKKLQVFLDVEHTKCGICLNVWHDVVTVAPCLHNFCNGCFSEWLRRCQQKHSSVLCPHCRAVVQFVGRNHFLHGIQEDILRADSSLRRSVEDLATLDKFASIKSNLIVSGRTRGRKRPQSMISESEISTVPSDESSNTEYPCRQCGTEIGGFRCNQDTVHLQCQVCGGMMPSRSDINMPQHCIGCDRAFCGAYWHDLGVSADDNYPLCNSDAFKRITERSPSQMPHIAHEGNLYEQEITERCIALKRTTLQALVSEMVSKLDLRQIDRRRLMLNHAEMITSGAHVCSDCYDKLVSFFLYWFRVTAPSFWIPPDVSDRENCWYGYACRTQHHSVDHARRRNHVCRPSRGSQM
ncbi:hypothetical protein Droror1_Dr00022977 [Drosera rotundifolia]